MQPFNNHLLEKMLENSPRLLEVALSFLPYNRDPIFLTANFTVAAFSFVNCCDYIPLPLDKPIQATAFPPPARQSSTTLRGDQNVTAPDSQTLSFSACPQLLLAQQQECDKHCIANRCLFCSHVEKKNLRTEDSPSNIAHFTKLEFLTVNTGDFGLKNFIIFQVKIE